MKDHASARQLSVAAFTGLLTPAAAVAGEDWRGALLAVPVVLLAAYCWGKLDGQDTGRPSGWNGAARCILSSLYLIWAVLTAGTVLASAGARMTAPDGRDAGWVIVLVWIPVLLLTRMGTAAYGRAAEIFYLGMLVALVFTLLLGGRQIRPERLLEESDGLLNSFATAVGVGCSGVAAFLLWDGEHEKGRWVGWSGALAGVVVLMRVATVGVLGPALAGEQERPFFLMTVGAGQTARVEGLAAAVWLLADVTLAGLMLQCGKKMMGMLHLPRERRTAWMIALAALGFALWMNVERNAQLWLKEVLPAAGLILGGVIPGLVCLVQYGNSFALQRKSEECQGKGGNEKS